MTVSAEMTGQSPRAAIAALRAHPAAAIRRALRSEVIGAVRDIGFSPFVVVQIAKGTAGPRAGGVNGLHGHLVRAPVDDAGRAGIMRVEAERPVKARTGILSGPAG